ncbi:hypothetical protein JAAARDRAFT_316326 [Jaapia argillacea MUCL 33604]|uniref:F-box domain-containing protein n=1 Tax=Jaapia argillacea MUCL 33604 TaxID=933084 RepID=A0A067PQ83_9AGAM|nr:hypothetical protein JAAARDRAFT_316326 [Jaapia argillacea MUCL 33604]
MIFKIQVGEHTYVGNPTLDEANALLLRCPRLEHLSITFTNDTFASCANMVPLENLLNKVEWPHLRSFALSGVSWDDAPVVRNFFRCHPALEDISLPKSDIDLSLIDSPLPQLTVFRGSDISLSSLARVTPPLKVIIWGHPHHQLASLFAAMRPFAPTLKILVIVFFRPMLRDVFTRWEPLFDHFPGICLTDGQWSIRVSTTRKGKHRHRWSQVPEYEMVFPPGTFPPHMAGRL